MDTERPTWTSGSDGEPVAAYDTPHGAELAAERLTDAGFAREAIAIRPLADRPLLGWRARARRDDGPSGLTVAVTVIATATIAVRGRRAGLVDDGDPHDHRRRRGRHRNPRPYGHHVVVAHPSRRRHADRRCSPCVEVGAGSNPSRAREVTARWWNPEAAAHAAGWLIP